MNLTCSYPTHAANSSQPGWNNGVLAVADSQVSGLVCPGCAVFIAANPPAAQVNQQTIANNVQGRINQIEAWLAANPNGAVLTAAQTAWLARAVAGLGRLVLDQVNSVGQAT